MCSECASRGLDADESEEVHEGPTAVYSEEEMEVLLAATEAEAVRLSRQGRGPG